MKIDPVSEKLISYLLDKVDGFRIEKIIQALLGIRDGEQFVALGGTHDGGADGFLRAVFSDKSKAKNFVQISAVEGVPTKIRGTLKRLLEVGRAVDSITYWSTRHLAVDQLEEKLTDELKITIRIRDFGAILNLINSNEKTREYFHSAFHAEISELTSAPPLSSEIASFISDPSVYVFLQFQKKDRFGKGGLAIPVLDSLIYWTLRDTEPSEDKLKMGNEIRNKIEELLPIAAKEFLPLLNQRLQVLSTRDGGGNQRIRKYHKTDGYCLPHAMRLELAAKSAGEIALQATVRESLSRRAGDEGVRDPKMVAHVCERVIYRHFHEQGLILTAFLENRLADISISDQIVESELQQVISEGTVPDGKSYNAALRVLQGVFYAPTEEENDFLHRLSKTSMLLFSLQHCPKLVEYFNKLTGKFHLLIGTDILIKAISETFLPVENRYVTNLLKVAHACGAKLLLTEDVVEEVYRHVHGVCLEFRNNYAAREPYITAAVAAQSDRILIRTYFYAKLLLNRVKGWKSFVNMFVDFEEVLTLTEKGKAHIQAYLAKTFELEFLSTDDERVKVDETKISQLAQKLEQRSILKNSALARNDARMVHVVYALRRAGKEQSLYDGFGYKTWWMTKETAVLTHTGDLVASEGAPYMMRPEFLLNFLSFAPATQNIDPALHELLPSHVGLQIGHHLSTSQMQTFMDEVEEWRDLPPARIEVRVTDAVNQLKYDRVKRYSANLDLNGQADTDYLLTALRGTI